MQPRHYESFVYCWTDVKRNMLYVGKHKGSVDDGYICSSKYLLSEYKSRPSDFTRSIIAFGSDSDMISLETTILKSENARCSKDYYNMHNNNGPGAFTTKGHSEKTKKKISESKLGKNRSLESRAKQSYSVKGDKNHFFRKTHSEEAKRKMTVDRKSIIGGNNPNSVKINYEGVTFDSIKEFRQYHNLSKAETNKLIKNGEAIKLRNIEHSQETKNRMTGPRKKLRGSGNAMSKRVIYDGVVYDSKAQLCQLLSISKYKLSSMISMEVVREVE